MIRSQNTDESPWWELQLPIIRDEQDSYLRQRLPALRADHEDLIGDTLLALTREIRRRPSAWPPSWFQHKPPTNEAERSHLHKLATVILRRRIADLFRKRKHASMPHLPIDEELGQEVADPHAAPPDRKILLARVLEVTSSVLDEMQPEDRDLVALISEDGFRKALNDKERQRLHRIRRKLKDEIARRLGANVADLLRITL